MNQIGVIGVGRMGRLMVELLIKNDFQVMAYDVYQPSLEYAEKLGAAAASSEEEVAENCSIILLSLPKPEHVKAVAKKIAVSAKKGTIVADTSTVDPGTSRENAEFLKIYGIIFLDTPILGLPHVAGNWIMPVGGDPEDVEKIKPVLLSFASKVVPVGGVGNGNAVKLLNNTMFAVINAISAEVMQMADSIGVDKNVFYDTVANSKAATVSGLFKEVGGRICDSRYEDPTFTLDLLRKDVNLGVQMARSQGMYPLVAATVLGINENACKAGFGDQDCSGIYNYMSRMYKGE